MSYAIRLSPTTTPFTLKPEGVKEYVCQHSFYGKDNAQGNFQFEGVSNGRYGKKHPIRTQDGEIVGAIKDGFSSVGYTYASVYAERARAFIVAHCYFRSSNECISFLEPAGRFGWFDSTPKYEANDSIIFQNSSWISLLKSILLFDEGRSLLLVSSCGLASINIDRRTLSNKKEMDLYSDNFAVDISPVVNNLALVSCTYDGKDKVTGEYRYTNSLRIIDMKTCDTLAETQLPPCQPLSWKVRFSACGRYVQTTSADEHHSFEMQQC